MVFQLNEEQHLHMGTKLRWEYLLSQELKNILLPTNLLYHSAEGPYPFQDSYFYIQRIYTQFAYILST